MLPGCVPTSETADQSFRGYDSQAILLHLCGKYIYGHRTRFVLPHTVRCSKVSWRAMTVPFIRDWLKFIHQPASQERHCLGTIRCFSVKRTPKRCFHLFSCVTICAKLRKMAVTFQLKSTQKQRTTRNLVFPNLLTVAKNGIRCLSFSSFLPRRPGRHKILRIFLHK